MLLHFLPISCHQEIMPDPKESFGVLPWRRNKRNAAGKSFKGSNRRNARQLPRIGATRNVNRRFETREHFGNLEVRHPAAKSDPAFIQLAQSRLRVTNAIDLRFPRSALHRTDEVLTQLFGSLL